MMNDHYAAIAEELWELGRYSDPYGEEKEIRADIRDGMESYDENGGFLGYETVVTTLASDSVQEGGLIQISADTYQVGRRFKSNGYTNSNYLVRDRI